MAPAESSTQAGQMGTSPGPSTTWTAQPRTENDPSWIETDDTCRELAKAGGDPAEPGAGRAWKRRALDEKNAHLREMLAGPAENTAWGRGLGGYDTPPTSFVTEGRADVTARRSTRASSR